MRNNLILLCTLVALGGCSPDPGRSLGASEAANESEDMATLDTLVSESRDFSKRDVHNLTRVLNEEVYAAAPERMLEIEDILIEKASSWSVVLVMPPTEEASKALAMVFQAKHVSSLKIL